MIQMKIRVKVSSAALLLSSLLSIKLIEKAICFFYNYIENQKSNKIIDRNKENKIQKKNWMKTVRKLEIYKFSQHKVRCLSEA